MKKIILLFTSIFVLTLCVAFNFANAQTLTYDKATAAKILTVKSSPSQTSRTLGKLKVGTPIQVYGGVPVGTDQYNWYGYQQYGYSKIKYGKTYGYVPAYQLKFANPYNWAPGVYTSVMKSLYANHYVSKKDTIRLYKGGVYANQGIYDMDIKRNGKGDWIPWLGINCKTGWYHG